MVKVMDIVLCGGGEEGADESLTHSNIITFKFILI